MGIGLREAMGHLSERDKEAMIRRTAGLAPFVDRR